MTRRIPYFVSRSPRRDIAADRFGKAKPEYGIRNTEYELQDFLRRIKNPALRVVSILLATLREIFDENAYARFLQLERLEPSRASYAAFLRENGCRRERRPRCC